MNIKVKQGSAQNLKPLIKFNPEKIPQQSSSLFKFKQIQPKNSISPQNSKMNSKYSDH